MDIKIYRIWEETDTLFRKMEEEYKDERDFVSTIAFFRLSKLSELSKTKIATLIDKTVIVQDNIFETIKISCTTEKGLFSCDEILAGVVLKQLERLSKITSMYLFGFAEKYIVYDKYTELSNKGIRYFEAFTWHKAKRYNYHIIFDSILKTCEEANYIKITIPEPYYDEIQKNPYYKKPSPAN